MTAAGVRECVVDPRVAAELPGLGLWAATVTGVRLGATPPEVRERLRGLADRIRGPQAVALRTRRVPQAYRVLFHHLGLDPDATRPPLEALVTECLLRGGVPSRGMPRDALALALLETGVPVWALDAAAVGGEPVLRPANVGDGPVPEGRLVIADDHGPIAVLFDAATRPPGPATTAVMLLAVQAPSVDALTVDEALWTARKALPTIGPGP
jgi:DNA/RNA-binding domain of Phe-tRNA-synthetase-like protein